MKKRVVATVLSVFALGIFVGCTKKAGDAMQTITYYGRPDKDLELAIIAQFENANENIKVNYVELPSSSNDRLKTIQTVLQTGGSEIDVFAGDAVWPSIFVSAGWVESLDNQVSAEVLDSFLPTMISAYKMNGKTYGLPFMADVCALYYRKDLLDKYNLEVPTTYSGILTISKHIMEKEGQRDLYGYGGIWVQNETLACSLLSAYWAMGGDVVGADGKSVIEIDKLERALKLMYNMMYVDKISPSGMNTFATNDMRNMVKAGNLIFAQDWLSGYAQYNDTKNSQVAGNMEITALPTNGALGGWGIMVSKYSKNKYAAIKFAQYRASYDAQLTAMKMNKIVPTIASMYDKDTVVESYEYLTKFLAPLSVARPRGLTPYYAEVSSYIQIETSAVISNLKTPAEAAASIARNVKALIGSL